MPTTTATRSTAGCAALVADYRAQIAADPELYDGDEDVAYWLLRDTPDRDWSPSEVARVIGVDTHEAHRILRLLADGEHIACDDRGAWTRYTARR